MNPMQSPNTGVGKRLCPEEREKLFSACWTKPCWKKTFKKGPLPLQDAKAAVDEAEARLGVVGWIEDYD